MEKWTDKTCVEFTHALGAKLPAPGGGGATAMAGALGAALCSMVCNYTIGKKKYAAVEEDVKAVLEKADALSRRLLELVNKDAEAFEPLSVAYRIPAEDPNREAILRKATLDACAAPFEMVKCCAKAIELLEEVRIKGSVMMISDTGCGALLCQAAMKAAAMNVYVNTKTLKDCEEADRMETEVDALLQEYLPVAERTAEAVMAQICG